MSVMFVIRCAFPIKEGITRDKTISSHMVGRFSQAMVSLGYRHSQGEIPHSL
jgi:hypothetical protein